MNTIGLLILIAITLCLLVLGKLFFYPRIKSWMFKRAQKEKYLTEQKELVDFEKEVNFHLSWAQDRGESTRPYSDELNEIRFQMENLQRKYPEVELSSSTTQ
jgi:hypothetical protein